MSANFKAQVPLMTSTPDPKESIAKTDVRSAQVQATLEAANNRLSTTPDYIMKTQRLFADNAKLLTIYMEQENRLSAIQAELKRLNETKLGLEETKVVLDSCIKLIVDVKAQITNLVCFFKSVLASIEDAIRFNVSSFIEQITAVASECGHAETVGSFALTDFQRSLIHSSAVTIRSHFSVFGDIAGMWVTLSVRNIKPGLELLDRLTETEKSLSERQAVIRKLQAWAGGAILDVKKVADATQKEIIDGLAQRVVEVEKTTEQIRTRPLVARAVEGSTRIRHRQGKGCRQDGNHCECCSEATQPLCGEAYLGEKQRLGSPPSVAAAFVERSLLAIAILTLAAVLRDSQRPRLLHVEGLADQLRCLL